MASHHLLYSILYMRMANGDHHLARDLSMYTYSYVRFFFLCLYCYNPFLDIEKNWFLCNLNCFLFRLIILWSIFFITMNTFPKWAIFKFMRNLKNENRVSIIIMPVQKGEYR